MELAEFINEATVESAMRWVQEERDKARESGDFRISRWGMRIAHAREPRLLAALEKGTEVLFAMSERQFGKSFTIAGKRWDATEMQMWREAYRTADQGEPCAAFDWIYAAAGRLAGLL